MNATIIYLLKVSMAIALVTLPYFIFMRRDPQLLVKRIYLAGGLVLSWIFPLITLTRTRISGAIEPSFFIQPQSAPVNVPVSPVEAPASFNWFMLLAIVYVAGMLLIFAMNISRFIHIKKEKTPASGIRNVFITRQSQVFTIFPKIFVPEKYANDPDLESILIHERAHIQQLHFIDLLISELTLLLTWFNPFSWLISRMIKENHEHLADRHVLSQGIHAGRYKALLLNHAMGGQVFRLGHQFNQSLTKNRFNMMKKMKSSWKGSLKYILAIPFIMLFTLAVTATTQDKHTIHGQVYLESKDTPAVGASVVIKNGTVGTVVNLDGTFSLDVEGNPELVISFVGYETVVKKASDLEKKPVIMNVTAISISLDKVPEPQPDVTMKIRIQENDKNAYEMKTHSKEMKLQFEDGKEPLIILDGKQVKSLDNIDPEDIESINVIKDQNDKTVKKYNAENGVIIITSRKEAGKEAEGEEEVFFVVEDVPSFPGGNIALGTFLQSNLVYPEDAKKEGIEGKVLVKFRVKADGSLQNFEVVRGVNPSLDKAALEVCKTMPAWNPGKQRGKRVSCNVIVPVVFKNGE